MPDQKKWEKKYQEFLELSVDEEILYILPDSGWAHSVSGSTYQERYGTGYALRKIEDGMEVRYFHRGAESEDFDFFEDDKIINKFQEIAKEFLEIDFMNNLEKEVNKLEKELA